MKKLNKIHLIVAILIVLVASCKKDDKFVYQGPFNVQWVEINKQLTLNGTLQAIVRLDAFGQQSPVTVKLTLSTDGVSEGTDFRIDTKEVTFEPGTYEKTITFTGVDNNVGADRTITATISEVSGGNNVEIDEKRASMIIDVIPTWEISHQEINLTVDRTNGWSGWQELVPGTDYSWLSLWNTDNFTEWRVYSDVEGHNVTASLNNGFVELTPLEEGVELGPDFDGWVGDYGWADDWTMMPLITSESYTAWNGTTSYAGIIYEGTGGIPVYMWLRYQVSADGQTVTLIDYAYEINGKSIKTGQVK